MNNCTSFRYVIIYGIFICTMLVASCSDWNQTRPNENKCQEAMIKAIIYDSIATKLKVRKLSKLNVCSDSGYVMKKTALLMQWIKLQDTAQIQDLMCDTLFRSWTRMNRNNAYGLTGDGLITSIAAGEAETARIAVDLMENDQFWFDQKIDTTLAKKPVEIKF